MRKFALNSFLILLTLISIFGFDAAFAESKEGELSEEISSQLSSINLDDFERFIEKNFGEIFYGKAENIIKDLISGKVSGLEQILPYLAQKATKYISSVVYLVVCIIIICILYNTQNAFFDSKSSTKGIVHLVLMTAVLVLAMKSIYEVVSMSVEAINVGVEFMNVVFPLLVTVLTVASGGVGASIFSPLLAVLSNTLANLVQNVAVPVFLISVVISIVGNLTDSVKLGSLQKFLKSFMNWLLGASFGLFSLFSAGAGLLVSGINAGYVNFTKNSISGYIPILGKYLEGGVDLAVVGSILIKNSLGVISIVIMLLIIVVPILKCAILSLSLNLCAGIVESFADHRVVNALNGISSGIKTLIFAVLAVGIAFFVVVAGVIVSIGAV